MNHVSQRECRLPLWQKQLVRWSRLAAILVALFPALPQSAFAVAKASGATAVSAKHGLAPCSSTVVANPTTITLGKSTLLRLATPAVRLVVGGLPSGYAGKPTDGGAASAAGQPAAPVGTSDSAGRTGVADVDVLLLGPSELYLLGKRVGSMNLILQNPTGLCTVMDIAVTMDAGSLQAKLDQLMPDEKNIKVSAAEDSIILSGEVSSALKVDRAVSLAAAYAPEKRVINLMRAGGVHQVMLEVKVAEVSRTILDQFGGKVNLTRSGSGVSYSIFSDFLSKGTGVLEALKLGKTLVQLNGERDDGVVRILAEPNIMAISGQQASFLSGGKIFIPVAQSAANAVGGTTMTLEEKEFGVGVKFTPTVLESGLINLKVASEVSELSQTGSPFATIGGVTSVLPSFTTRRADTSVQLNDGQSFAIAGLIKNNLAETSKRFPGLGDIPLLGALFRSTEFQKDMTELLFIITPRLVKPLPPNYALPTDSFTEPGRSEMVLGGKLEGDAPVPSPSRQADKPQAVPTPPGAGGFETK